MIDEKIDRKRLEQFASELAKLPVSVIEEFEEQFGNEQNADFYYGMIKAYSNVYSVINKIIPGSDLAVHLGVMTAYLADKIIKLEDGNPFVSELSTNTTKKPADRSI